MEILVRQPILLLIELQDHVRIGITNPPSIPNSECPQKLPGT